MRVGEEQCDGSGACVECGVPVGGVHTCVEELAEARGFLENPPCECRQVDVDIMDARGCPAHGRLFPWCAEEYLPMREGTECPF